MASLAGCSAPGSDRIKRISIDGTSAPFLGAFFCGDARTYAPINAARSGEVISGRNVSSDAPTSWTRKRSASGAGAGDGPGGGAPVLARCRLGRAPGS